MSYAGFDQSENDVREIERHYEQAPDEPYPPRDDEIECPYCGSSDVEEAHVYIVASSASGDGYECQSCGEVWVP
jgi:DNA-directed RNA polymerase subunit RPC12/RpoP